MRTAAALLALSLSLPLFAGGCVNGLHSNQPAQQAYVLSPLPHGGSGVAAANAEDTLQVLLPVAAAGLSGESIAVIRPGQRLDYYSGARWAGAAPSMLQMLAIEALRRQGRFSLVESDIGPFDARYVLSLELTHFEADYAGNGPPTVRVALVCTLGRRASRSVIASFTAQSAVMADADRMQAVVAAFERATDDALSQMTAALAPPPAANTAADGAADTASPAAAAAP